MLTQRNSKLTINEAKYSRMDQVKFVEDSLWNIWSDRVCWDPFLNTLPQICQNIITMPFSSSYYNVYVKAISDILLLFGSSNSQGFTSNIKISRFITYPHDKYNHFFFVHILFSKILSFCTKSKSAEFHKCFGLHVSVSQILIWPQYVFWK